MDLVFGWDCDAGGWPEIPDGSAAGLGQAVIGPLGLLSVLETALGLSAPPVPAVRRIARWQRKVAAVGDGQFWSQAFAEDAWATARLLLSWRDILIDAGWHADLQPHDAPRLTALAAIEKAGPSCHPGSADRLRSVILALKDARALPMRYIRLIDSVDLLSPGWRTLFDRLANCNVHLESISGPSGSKHGDLAAVQAWLSAGEKKPLAGDGTFAVITSETEDASAELLASWLAAEPKSHSNLVAVLGSDTAVLDAHLQYLHQPRFNFGAASPFRGALQVLPLAFSTRWAPFDPFRLLDLLLLPRPPIPRIVARRFVRALQSEPGIGGSAWNVAKLEAVHRYRERLEGQGLTGPALERQITQAETDWLQWLEGPRFDPQTGMPVADAQAIASRIAAWAMRSGNDHLFQNVAGLGRALADAVAETGSDTLSRAQIDRMIDAVVGDGLVDPDSLSDASEWAALENPGQVWGDAHTVLWWGFGDPGFAAEPNPWREAERKSLASMGCALDPPDRANRRAALAWRRPILAARERAILIAPRTKLGQDVAPHPLWHELNPLLRDSPRGIILSAEECLSIPDQKIFGRRIVRSPVSLSSEPVARRTWSIPAEAIKPREVESASSIELLLSCPFAWVLRYFAGLQPGAQEAVPDGNTLIGNLGHAVVAAALKAGTPPSRAEAERDAERILDELIEKIAAPLQLPGRSSELQESKRSVIAAVGELAEMIRSASLEVESTESTHQAEMLPGTKLSGRVDLLTRDPKTKQAVILDLKWASSDRYRMADIEEGRPVQLAAYARLLDAPGRPQVGAGYFMLAQRRMLYCGKSPIPNVTSISGPSLEEVWQKTVSTWRDRMATMRAGAVVATGVDKPTEAENQSPALVIDPPCKFCPYDRLCGSAIGEEGLTS